MVLKTSFWAKPPNLMTANISGYTVCVQTGTYKWVLTMSSKALLILIAAVSYDHDNNGVNWF